MRIIDFADKDACCSFLKATGTKDVIFYWLSYGNDDRAIRKKIVKFHLVNQS